MARGMPDQFDIVVAGAGHNSLIATAYLAKAGFRCLVLESRAMVGGGVKTAQITLRGFKHDVCSSAHVLIQDTPILSFIFLSPTAVTSRSGSTSSAPPWNSQNSPRRTPKRTGG